MINSDKPNDHKEEMVEGHRKEFQLKGDPIKSKLKEKDNLVTPIQSFRE